MLELAAIAYAWISAASARYASEAARAQKRSRRPRWRIAAAVSSLASLGGAVGSAVAAHGWTIGLAVAGAAWLASASAFPILATFAPRAARLSLPLSAVVGLASSLAEVVGD
jgi:hypothetical protein